MVISANNSVVFKYIAHADIAHVDIAHADAVINNHMMVQIPLLRKDLL
jgi:hypothetical protein